MRGESAVLNYYYHYALLAVGGEVMSGFEQALIPVRMAPIMLEAEALGATEGSMQTFLLPMTSDDHALYNPSLDYAVYLTLPIFYIMFQILVLLTTLYALGSESKMGTARDWLQSANYRTMVSVGGKLLPYTLFFVVEALLANYVFFYWLRIPMAGSIGLFSLISVLFIIATQAVAVILYSLFPVLSLVISVVSMFGSLGATLSGLTFPLTSMYPIIQYVALLFPLRHFTEAMQRIVYYGGGFTSIAPMLLVLCLFPLVAILLLPRLKRILLIRRYDTLE
jgi:ABC-2 type transport system permease protein